MKFSKESLIFEADLYNFSIESPYLPLNFAMETWLTRNKYQTEASIGNMEVMVWFYSNKLTPGGEKVGVSEIPYTLNGSEKSVNRSCGVQSGNGVILQSTQKSNKTR